MRVHLRSFLVLLTCVVIAAACAGKSKGTGGATVTLEARNQYTQALVPDVAVVVNDTAGAVVKLLSTGADGRAVVTVPRGGSVSVYQLVGQYYEIQTWVAPPSGTLIPVTALATPVPTTTPDATTFHVTPTGVPAGANSVAFAGMCDGIGATATSPFVFDATNGPCTTDSLLELEIVAVGSSGLLAWANEVGIAPAPGTIANLSVPLVNTGFDTVTMAITGLDAAGTFADLSLAPSGAVPPHHSIYVNDLRTLNGPLPSAFSSTLMAPHGLAPSVGMYWDQMTNSPPEQRYWSKFQRASSAPVSADADTGEFVQVVLNTLDTSMTGRPRVSWSRTNAPTGDVIRGRVFYDNLGSGGTTTVVAFFTLPPDHEAAFRVPEIPPELGAWSSVGMNYTSWSIGYSDIGPFAGYADALSHPANFNIYYDDVSDGITYDSSSFWFDG